MLIEGGDNPRNVAAVTSGGQLKTIAITETEQQDSAVKGLTYNVNTDELTLTNDAETPLFYIRNTGETNVVKVSRIFKALSDSDGTGPARARVYYNPTGGTILSATVLEVFNFNAGSARELQADARLGATGVTFSGGIAPIKFLFPTPKGRFLTVFDNIILPRGTSMLLTYTPPSGNTSQVVQAGCNIFVKDLDL